MVRRAHGTPIYSLAEQFRERCVVDDRSLLWPSHQAWTLENLDRLWTAFMDNPNEGSSSFFEKWQIQLANESDDVHRIAADLIALYYLFPSNIGPDAKMSRVGEVMNWKLADQIVDSNILDLEAGVRAGGLGHAGISYSTHMPWQIAYYLEFARRAKREAVDSFDPQATTDMANSVGTEIAGSLGARNVLLHLLFPDDFEPIASQAYKQRVIKAFPEMVGDATDIDEALRRVRAQLGEKLGRPQFLFWDADVEPLWSPEVAKPSRFEASVRPTAHVQEPPARLEDEPLQRLQDLTFLDRADIEELASLLKDKRQLIFEGPPGSGKTYVADRFARWFVGAPLGSMPTAQVEIIQFHQSYGYEDFVQGIRPETDEHGHLVYRVRDGIFKRLCDVAASNPDLSYVLIIDEINRGNISRIFGELLLLLEYREQRVLLPYSASDDGDDGYLTIPSNLYLIGTMNSTDRSLAQIDYALRRRFYFWRFAPVVADQAPVLERWLETRDISDGARRQVLQIFLDVNRIVSEQISPDFQIGHSYFMIDDIATPLGMDRVMRRAIHPLLDEYLHGRRDRDSILADIERSTELANSIAREVAEREY